MCDRTKAIQFIITNQYGSKEELEDQIHEHYNTFVVTGFIFEPSCIVDNASDSNKPSQVREWVATPEAYKRARLLNIKPDIQLHLKSSPKLRKNKLKMLMSDVD